MSGLLVIWIVFAIAFYVPFQKWTATSQAPWLSALFWPVFLGLFVVIIVGGAGIGILDHLKRKLGK